MPCRCSECRSAYRGLHPFITMQQCARDASDVSCDAAFSCNDAPFPPRLLFGLLFLRPFLQTFHSGTEEAFAAFFPRAPHFSSFRPLFPIPSCIAEPTDATRAQNGHSKASHEKRKSRARIRIQSCTDAVHVGPQPVCGRPDRRGRLQTHCELWWRKGKQEGPLERKSAKTVGKWGEAAKTLI